MRNTWKGSIAGGIVLALSLAAHASDDEPTDLPPIVAYGHFEGGGFAICRGAACAGALAGLEDRNSELSMERTLEPQDEMSRETFCAALKYKRPKDCDANNPPSTPGLEAGWAPNGCGTGGVSNFLVATALELGFGDNYSGNSDAPYAVSFKPSCDAHDACWGVAGNRSTCDDNFDRSMRDACSALYAASSRTICNGFAGAYFGAVSASDIGNANYAHSVAARECALWAHDMKANQCES